MIDLRLGDCLELMKTLPDGSVDAVITDPPYGIGNNSWKRTWHGNNGKSPLWNGVIPEWDKAINQSAVDCAIKISRRTIIWGGNNYALPPTKGWLVWDKLQENRGADCELA